MTRAWPRRLGAATFIALMAGASALPARAQSDDGARWQQSGFDAASGRTQTLSYAIPETDAWSLSTMCEAGAAGPPPSR